jgi:hypothetical protein
MVVPFYDSLGEFFLQGVIWNVFAGGGPLEGISFTGPLEEITWR